MPVLLVKQQISVSEPPVRGGLTGNICDSSLAGWKACSQLRINYNWIFLAISYDWGTNTSKSIFVEGVGHFGTK